MNIMTKEAFEFGLFTVERVIAPDTITYGRPGRLPHKISRTERPKIASRTTVDIGGLLGPRREFVHSVIAQTVSTEGGNNTQHVGDASDRSDLTIYSN